MAMFVGYQPTPAEVEAGPGPWWFDRPLTRVIDFGTEAKEQVITLAVPYVFAGTLQGRWLALAAPASVYGRRTMGNADVVIFERFSDS